ncbi:MAG TPA: squalene synthase HpnC [Stellaceae bacterium]|nr:squalene synthase HpnC [Stellaceae bacterium]
MAERTLNGVETPSGKGAGDENFPVGSFLIRRELRPHVHAFYRFARQADDIADNPDLSPEEKVRRLDRMGEILDGSPGNDSPAAVAMRTSLRETGITARHCHDVLRAFRLDATKKRYRDWDDPMEYCRYSASPVGRQVLDLHGEAHGNWPANDALCSALQVLNHLQDCGEDFRNLDRVYLPESNLAACGATVAELGSNKTSAGLRAAIDRLLDGTDRLIVTAQTFPAGVKNWGLRCEVAAIVELASRLAAHLRQGDPLAGRVKLTKGDFLSALLLGTWRGSWI